MDTLLIFGAGGHGRVVADAALATGRWQRVLASDRSTLQAGGELLPGVALIPAAQAAGAAVHVAIGDAAARAREAAAWPQAQWASVIHPQASVSPHAQLGPGCFVAARAVVGPLAELGAAVIVNHGAVVDHDVRVGDFSHVAPLCALGGAARIGQRVLLGAGVTVLPGIRVADDVVIGAGAVVTQDLMEPGTYAGVPARRVK